MYTMAGGSFKRTKIQLTKSFSECGDGDGCGGYDETKFQLASMSPQKRQKTKNTVAFAEDHDADEFKRYNTVKTSNAAGTTNTNHGNSNNNNNNVVAHNNKLTSLCLNASDTLKSQYLLQQQQRIKEYNNQSRCASSYSDTYSSSSSDYRSVVKAGPATGGGGGGDISQTSKSNLLTRRSTQSLCSCDAETEIVPDPLRPLYQYSLDRKKHRHTYTCEQNAQILLRLEREHQKKYGSAGRLDIGLNNDIPPLPPALSRKTSFNTHQNRQQQQQHHHQRTNSYKNNINMSSGKPGGGGGGGGGSVKLNNCENSISHAMNYSQQHQHQQQQQQQQQLNNKPDLFNFSSSAANATIIDHKNKLLLNDGAPMTDELPLKPYPPFYFDDNHFHHCGGGGVGVGGAGIGNVMPGNKENELFFYHHEPANYIPNYDTMSFSKFNTIGAPQTKFHASTCNLNHFHEGNLMNGHQWTSLSNFNHPATPVLPYHQFHATGTTFGGGSSLIGGSYNSTGSISEKKDIAWKHRNCPSRNSSSSGTNSGKWDLPSRQWLAVTSILLITAAAGVAVPLALRVSAGAPLEERIEAATQLLESVPLIDGHNDLPWNIRKFVHSQLNGFQFDSDLKQVKPWATSIWSHTDLQRMKKGRISAQFWAAYAPCEAQFKDAVQITIEQIDLIKRLTERYTPQLIPCSTALDITEAHKNHRICSLIGLEGGHTLGGSLAVLRIYYELGVRYMTLTSSTCHTTWADSHNADAPKFDVKHGGLTQYGKIIVREMNRLGMIVDLSKSAVSTMKDVLQLSEAPVIFSHSSAYELCNSSRNVQNEIIQMVAKKRGIVMINFYSRFLSCSNESTVFDAVAHINHIKRIVGVDFVGLGAGFDGINFVPEGLEDVSTYPRLFAELMGTGWTAEELTKLASENFLRVMTEVEQVRDNQRKMDIKPFEDPPNSKADDPFNCSTNS